MNIIEKQNPVATRGWFTITAEQGDRGTLSHEEYLRFKPRRGPSPQVFRVTEKVKEAYVSSIDREVKESSVI